MRKIPLAMVMIAVFMLTGCFGDTGEGTVEATQPQVEPAVTEHSQWVQDLWVYNQIQTVTPDGEVVDLTEEILSGLGTPSSSEPMPNGATFHVHPSLAPTVTLAGEVRSDLSVIAGVLETEFVRALAVLATPRPDAQASVGVDDAVEIDVTFLGDLLTPCDPLVTDVIFIQTRPGEGEPQLEDVALLAERLTNGRAFTYGTQAEEGVRILPLTGVLGEAVAGSTRMSLPGKGGLPFPDLTGPMGELFCPKVFFGPSEALKCIEDYFQEMINVADDTRNLLECNLGGCDTPAPDNYQELCIGLDCDTPKVRSDPHLLSFDGQALSMQGVGEYVLSRGPGFEMQMRTAAVGAHGTASAVTMVAVQVGDDRAVIGTETGSEHMGVWINDVLVPYDSAEGYRQQSRHGGFGVTQTAYEVLIESSDGSKFYIRRGLTNWLDLSMKLSESLTNLTGLLGDRDGDPTNDWRARDGSVLAADAKGRVLYTVFSDTWRVTEDESILRYLPGENTSTFTDMSYPEQIVTLEDLDPAVRAQAERLCELAGVTDEALLGQCTLDYALTGEISFVLSAQYVERDVQAYEAHLASHNRSSGTDGLKDPAAWSLSPSSADAPDSEVFSHVCPPNGVAHPVWGGDGGIYTADSSICTAAVHAGLITLTQGGTVEVTRLDGLDNYGSGTTHNGITTRAWQRPWPESFRVER